MLEYRFFTMRDDGSIKAAAVEHLPDDISALDRARALMTDNTIEGWQNARMVFRLLPDGNSGA